VGRDRRSYASGADRSAALTAFLDANVLIRHLTGDPPEMTARATTALAGEGPLLLPDLVLAECLYVLESFYELGRARVAELMRAALALPAIATVGTSVLMRARGVRARSA
jgi:predicted nucleic acid-binding protein